MTAVPAMQTGHRIHAWGGELHWEEFATPEPRPGEVLVEVEACGVGLTTLNCVRGDLGTDPAALPLVPGHEYVGRVVQAGDAEGASLVGQRIAAYFYLSCGHCPACISGWDQRCEQLAGHVGVDLDGGYAPFATLPVRNALTIAEDLDAVEATLVPDAIATPVHVCGARAQLGPGDRAVVIGAGGGVGAHLIQVAGLHGAQVLGVEAAEDKLDVIEDLGVRAMAASELDDTTPSALFAGGSPTVVIDLVGSEQTLAWGLDAIGAGGRLVVVTTFLDRRMLTDPRTLVFREASIVASRYARRSEVLTAAELLRNGDVRPVIGGVVAPAEVHQLHDQLRSQQLMGRGAIDWRTG